MFTGIVGFEKIFIRIYELDTRTKPNNKNSSSTIFEIELFEMLIKMSFSGFSFDWQSNWSWSWFKKKKNGYNMYE